jgi:probable HAF family extracellular repeat protein
VVAVAATDNNDARASFSNYGATTVHLGAPGVRVLSTIVGGGYAYFNGTSMATPHVSGAALLVLSQCALNTASLKSNILDNIDPIASLAGNTITGGRLNVNKAIRGCTATPEFTISASPASQSIVQGASTSYTATVTAFGGFNGTVTFSVSGLPAEATGTFTPPSVVGSGSSTLSVSTAATTPAGSYPLTITATSGTLSHSAVVTLVVFPAGGEDFNLGASPASQWILQGSSGNYAITITPTGGFTDTVTLSVSDLPELATASFAPNPATSTSTLTVDVDPNTPEGSFVLAITGTSGNRTHTIAVTLVVAHDQPRFISLDKDTLASGISGDGSIVIGNYYPVGTGAFYWMAETGTVPIGGSSVGAISADGTTIVGIARDATGVQNAAIWQGDRDWQLLGSFTPDAANCGIFLSSAYGVNGDGSVIVGLGWNGCGYAHGFRLDAETGMTDLGALAPPRASRANAISADGSAIVGWSDQATGFRQGARWVDGAWQWLSSDYGPVGEALAVNSSGSMIVGYGCGPFNQWAWYWTEENGVQCINGPVPEPNQTYTSAVSDDGSVIAGAVRPVFGPETEAVLWFNLEPVNLRQYLLDNGVSAVQSWTLSWVNAVSADGSVVAGTGIGPDLRLHSFVVVLPPKVARIHRRDRSAPSNH